MGVYRKWNQTEGKYYWYIDYYLPNGKRKREAVGSSKREAELLLGKRKAQIREGKLWDLEARLPRVRFEGLAAKYLEHAKTHKRSWMRDRFSLKHLRTAFGSLLLSEIDRERVDQYIQDRVGEGAAKATINREVACLSAAFRKAIEWSLAKENPVRGVKPFREYPKERYLSQEEIDRLLEAAAQSKSRCLLPIVQVALHTGLRRSELLNLRWDQVIFQQEIITLHAEETKGGARRTIPMDGTAVETLKALPRFLHSPYVFCNLDGQRISSVRRALDKALREAGIEDCTLHTLRHTFASHLVMAGVDLVTVKELLGHKEIKTTMRYAHLAPEHKRGAVARLETQLRSREQVAAEY